MERIYLLARLLIVCLALGAAPAAGQDKSNRDGRAKECPGPVYKRTEVTEKARIIHVDNPQYTEEARRNQVRGKVVLRAVLCVTGRVTDIEVVKGLPHGLTEKAIETMPRMKFKPAEKDGAQVSQYILREFNFNIY
ncbi:MAG TPA: energy transducer TonB [Pyrinomonadaceae bacterium]|jgi:TonB family protein